MKKNVIFDAKKKKTRRKKRSRDDPASSSKVRINKQKQKIFMSNSSGQAASKARQAAKKAKPLMKTTSVFPFAFFPDTVLVYETKVDIVHRTFFFSKRMFTILINDIRTVEVLTGPFFATMRFEVKGFEQNPKPVPYLNKQEARKMRELILGLCVAHAEDIDIKKISTHKKIKKKMSKLGKVHA